MKLLFKNTSILLFTSLGGVSFSSGSLIITGLADPDGGVGDILELYATMAIPDLSIYGLEKTANGSFSGGSQSVTLPMVALGVGEFYYVTTDQTDFTQFLGFSADFEWSALNVNGNDSVLLYESGTVVDIVLEDGDSTDIHDDGWIYRNNGEGPNPTYDPAEWVAERNVLDSSNDETNADSPTPMPVGAYVPEPSSVMLAGLACLGLLCQRRR